MADDPMAETDKSFYDIVNQEDWQFDFEREFEIEDQEVEMESPIMQYWIPSPIPGTFVRVDFTMEQHTSKRELMDFLNNLSNFINDELGENYG